MEFVIDFGLAAGVLVIVGALAFGVIAQFIGETRTGFEWLVDAIAVAIGAIVASEFVIAWQTIEPVWDGLAILPAVLGGLVVGLIVEVLTRTVTGGTYHHRPMSA